MNVANFLLLLVNLVLVVTGQTLIKFGVNNIGNFSAMPFIQFVVKAFTTIPIVVGIFLYVISTVVWLMLLSRVSLSVAYPSLSLGYLAILFVSWFYLGESVNFYQVVGVLLVIAGLSFIYTLGGAAKI